MAYNPNQCRQVIARVKEDARFSYGDVFVEKFSAFIEAMSSSEMGNPAYDTEDGWARLHTIRKQALKYIADDCELSPAGMIGGDMPRNQAYVFPNPLVWIEHAIKQHVSEVTSVSANEGIGRA